jgi:hypothetical protein
MRSTSSDAPTRLARALPYRALAELVTAFHLSFALFVVLGGLLVLRWPWLAWIHLPAAAWGALGRFVDTCCFLTPLEKSLRRRAGGAAYEGGFLDHYIIHRACPAGLGRRGLGALGLAILAVNVAIYAYLFSR